MKDPVFIQLGPITIYWYGVTAAIATVASFFFVRWIGAQMKIKAPIEDMFIWLGVWGLVGARLYHVFNEPAFYWNNPLLIPAVWQGGLAIHGGVLAGSIALWYFTRKYKTPFLALADVFAPAILSTLAIARWGNFFNQELFGMPTNLPWGIFIDPVHRPNEYAAFTHFHPVFLYESLWSALGSVLVILMIKKRSWRIPGQLFAFSFLLWSLGRAGVELLRIDNVPLLFGIRLPLIVSMLIFLTAGILLRRFSIRNNRIYKTQK